MPVRRIIPWGGLVLMGAMLGAGGRWALRADDKGRVVSDRPPCQVALLDLGHVFQTNARFHTLRDALKEKLRQAEVKLKQIEEEHRSLKERLKELKSRNDTEGAAQVQAEIDNRESEFTAFRSATQRRILEEEANIYRIIYLDVSQAVARYARARGIRLVLMNDAPKKNAEDPDKLKKQLAAAIGYEDGLDITDDIVQAVLEENATGDVQK